MKILITGATGGIAYKLGIKLANKGHFVYMTTHTKNQAQELNKKIINLNLTEKIQVLKLDITNKIDAKIINDLDIDTLFLHASIGEGGSILNIPIDKLKYNYEVNVFSNIKLIKKYIKSRTTNNKQGKIIITSSITSMIPIPYLGSYTSSKAALSMLIKTLNKEIKDTKSNIKVYLVEPGAYHTGFNQVMINKIGDYNSLQKQLKIFKLFRLIESKNINSIVEKMIYLTEHNSIKLIHRTPLLQRILIKLYLIFIA